MNEYRINLVAGDELLLPENLQNIGRHRAEVKESISGDIPLLDSLPIRPVAAPMSTGAQQGAELHGRARPPASTRGMAASVGT